MPEQKFSLFRLSDKEVLEAFGRITPVLDPDYDGRLQLWMGDNYTPIETSVKSAAGNEVAQSVVSIDGTILVQMALYLQHNITVIVRRKPDALDECTISFQGDVPPVNLACVVIAARTNLKPINRMETVERILGPELTEFYRRREQRLMNLEELSERLIRETTEYRPGARSGCSPAASGRRDPGRAYEAARRA